MEDSTIRGDRYGMSGALPPSQEKRVQLEEDNGFYDIAEPRHYQKKTHLLPRPQAAAKIQGDCFVIKETIPIKKREDKTRFQVGSFFETPVPLPMWQRLGQSPQSKVQLARAIVSSWAIKSCTFPIIDEKDRNLFLQEFLLRKLEKTAHAISLDHLPHSD